MRTIEITLPTSARDLKLQEKIVRASSLIVATVKPFVVQIANHIVTLVWKTVSLIKLYYSKFRKISFEKRSQYSGEGSGLKRIRKPSLPKFPKKYFRYFAYFVVIGVFVFFAGRFLSQSPKGENTEQLVLQDATAYQDVNREFFFPLLTSDDEEVDQIKYEILSVEKRNDILVKGRKLSTIKGRKFLIFSIRITNDYSKPVEINTRDYVRLSLNGNQDEWLAPEIYNDPVVVQAISTRNTRIGFQINDSDSNLVIRVGEIDGQKELIELDL